MARVTKIRACAPNLAAGHLVTSAVTGDGWERSSMHGDDKCPQHDDPTALRTAATGSCLDAYWSQHHLAGLSLLDAWRLWRSWRRQAGMR
jgi:hypothetical protein